jgi:hypothetical protein
MTRASKAHSEVVLCYVYSPYLITVRRELAHVPNTTPSIRLMVIEVKLHVLLISALDERKLPGCVTRVQELRYAQDRSMGDPPI